MVGGTEVVHVDVRVIAATNKNLEETVAAGKFREDLFYRLQIVPVALPPLRERAEDIPLLIAAFLEHFAAKHKRRRKTFSREAMQLCQRFPWPGNVRQLRNMVERLIITCPGAMIEMEDLPDFLCEHDQNANRFTIQAGMTMAEIERLAIRQTLTHVSSNREQAAKVLGISRRTLQYKLKQYGLLENAEAEQSV
jgi:transcriptional regulator with PAS, ATPase and Fis domain